MIDEGFSQIFLRKCGADEKFLAGTCGNRSPIEPFHIIYLLPLLHL